MKVVVIEKLSFKHNWINIFFPKSFANYPIFTSLGLPNLTQCLPCSPDHTALLYPCIQMVGKQYCFDKICTINPSEKLQQL